MKKKTVLVLLSVFISFFMNAQTGEPNEPEFINDAILIFNDGSIQSMPSESVTGTDLDGDGTAFNNDPAAANSGIDSSSSDTEGGQD